MFSCNHLFHPFLNDPGTSQNQRLPDALAEDSTPIDGREISDFLNYFAGLSHQINFYSPNPNTTPGAPPMLVSDWGPYFSGDLPFLLSSIAAFDGDAVSARYVTYSKLFAKRPSAEGLQLLFLYTWYSVIDPIQQWAAELQNTNLDLEQTLQTLIKDRLPTPIKGFISCMNTAIKCFCIQPVDVSGLLINPAWGLTTADLTAYDTTFSCTLKSSQSQLLSLQSTLSGLVSFFTDVITIASTGAADQVNDNLYGVLTANGLADTPPHLALLYSFLDQYLNVLNDLNNLSQDHLNFFFQDVLQLSPGPISPDHAYIIFTLQKQVPSYPLPAGLSLKDGKDNNNADIYFTLDAPVVITQTQATTFSTVFVNTPVVNDIPYVEGVYMAPDATKSDGLTQAFPTSGTTSWATLGAKQSQYTPPQAQAPVDYPLARIGFILTSKILYMNEGTRKLHIQLACQWGAGTCDTIDPKFAQAVCTAVNTRYILVTQDLLDQAVTLKMTTATMQALQKYYLVDHCNTPLCGETIPYLSSKLVILTPGHRIDPTPLQQFWEAVPMQAYELEIWKELIQPQRLFTLQFSGQSGWVTPEVLDMEMEIIAPAAAGTPAPPTTTGNFLLHFYAIIRQDQPAITFYNAAKLGEDFGTTDPLVKIQLNTAISMDLPTFLADNTTTGQSSPPPPATCCLNWPTQTCGGQVSYYTFFRNVVLLKQLPETPPAGKPHVDYSTKIHLTVCGVKNLVLQNDNNALSAKKPFTPFGVKPVVPDFDCIHSLEPVKGMNLIGPNFYIGSTEIFLKKWDRVNVNLNWQGNPIDLKNYYAAYKGYINQKSWEDFGTQEINLAVLHNISWNKETSGPPATQNTLTNDFNRPFLSADPFIPCTDNPSTYQYSFELKPKHFGLEGELQYDPTFAPLTSYTTGVTMNGFIRMTLENQDFLHKIYPSVMAAQTVLLANHKPSMYPIITPAPLLPNEPWTPTILNIALDYEATAHIEDMQLIQLYPFTGTYNSVDIIGQQYLLANFCNEGNLFIGLSGLNPGDGLSVLFQLAEATAATEGGAATVTWQYLVNNQWQPLRPGFEIIQDNTNGLSTTGIIQFQFPNDISNSNTILPAGLYWITANTPGNTVAIGQTIAILTQAASATFANNTTLNDQNRPATPLPAGSITKLTTPDSSVTGVSQPYASFGGQAPEISGIAYPVRVSERLRHKGRAIQKWDYERMVLQQFPKLLAAKCINHSYCLNADQFKWDFPMYPGSIILAVLPDPSQLAVTNSAQPTVPTSMLIDIGNWFTGTCSQFITLTPTNPRYEPVDICVSVLLQAGMNAAFYTNQLQTDIGGFLAPWTSGNTDAFQFAQRLYRSDLMHFIESLDYIDNLLTLNMCHEGDTMPSTPPDFIAPLTPRSILVAGKIIVNAQQPPQASALAALKTTTKNLKLHGRKH